MIKFLKSRLLTAALLLTLLEIVGGLLLMAPLLVFMRLRLEHSGLALELWPLISPKILADLLINHSQVLIICLAAAAVIYLAYFPLKTLFAAAIYNMITVNNAGSSLVTKSLSEHIRRAVAIWPGFLKTAVFGMLIYLLAFFIGLMFGGILGRVWDFFRPLAVLLMLLTASTYLQILKLRMVRCGESSLRDSIRETRSEIAGAFGRIMIGNFAVFAAAVIIVMIPWSILKWVRSFEWNYLTASISIVLQQLIIILICLAQTLRINFNQSLFGKGD